MVFILLTGKIFLDKMKQISNEGIVIRTWQLMHFSYLILNWITAHM
jgi:hypothetical protein